MKAFIKITFLIFLVLTIKGYSALPTVEIPASDIMLKIEAPSDFPEVESRKIIPILIRPEPVKSLMSLDSDLFIDANISIAFILLDNLNKLLKRLASICPAEIVLDLDPLSLLPLDNIIEIPDFAEKYRKFVPELDATIKELQEKCKTVFIMANDETDALIGDFLEKLKQFKLKLTGKPLTLNEGFVLKGSPRFISISNGKDVSQVGTPISREPFGYKMLQALKIAELGETSFHDFVYQPLNNFIDKQKPINVKLSRPEGVSVTQIKEYLPFELVFPIDEYKFYSFSNILNCEEKELQKIPQNSIIIIGEAVTDVYQNINGIILPSTYGHVISLLNCHNIYMNDLSFWPNEESCFISSSILER